METYEIRSSDEEEVLGNAIFTADLGLPEDVRYNSPDFLMLNGDIKGDDNEIIVITQFKRQVFNATVCHYLIEPAYEGAEEFKIFHKVIRDMPGYSPIIIKDKNIGITVKRIRGVLCTMVCMGDLDYGIKPDSHMPNWLF